MIRFLIVLVWSVAMLWLGMKFERFMYADRCLDGGGEIQQGKLISCKFDRN